MLHSLSTKTTKSHLVQSLELLTNATAFQLLKFISLVFVTM